MDKPTSHCQICERAILANTGVIAHHGYKRPGSGWQTRSCFGARYRPYEVACDALPPAIESCERYIAQREAFLADWLANPPATVTEIKGHRGGISLTYDRPEGFTPRMDGSYRAWKYEGQYYRIAYAAKADIRDTKAALERMRKRLADWKPPVDTAA